MNVRVRWRLAAMMALIYAVQGAWWPLLAVHLHDLGVSGRGLGWIFATYAIACVAAPLGVGRLADHRLPSQRLLSLIFLAGTGMLGFLASGPTTRPDLLFALFLAYWLITAPAYALANSLAFRNMSKPTEQFGGVRLFGTIGWMTVGWLVSALIAWHGPARSGPGTYEAFWLATALSAVFAFFCLTLPHTPPLAVGQRRRVDLREGLELVRRRPVAMFLACAFCVSLSTPFVYQTVPPYLQALGMPRSRIPLAMSLGQVLEIGALAVLPWLLRRVGHWGTLAFGTLAWMTYYAALATHPPLAVALAVLPLNGVAIACFIVTGQMYLDSYAPRQRRASAQGLHVMVTSGIGALLGNLLAGEIVSWNGGVGAMVFIAPCAMNAAALLLVRWGARLEASDDQPLRHAMWTSQPARTSGAVAGMLRCAPGPSE
jgi:MFS family permease